MVPILLACGIGFYFSGYNQFPFMYASLIGGVLLFCALLIRKKSALIQYILLTFFFIIFGYVLADYRIYSVAT